MATEIVKWCDVCFDAEQRVPGETVEVTLAGKPRTIEICGPHREQFVDPLATLLDEHGVTIAGHAHTPKRSKVVPRQAAPQQRSLVQEALIQGAERGSRRGKKPEGEVTQCFYCPLTYALGKSAGGWTTHMRNAHGYGSRLYVTGDTCAVCGQDGLRAPSAHVVRKHADLGISTAEEAVWWAGENGDPYGVYDAVMNREPDLERATA